MASTSLSKTPDSRIELFWLYCRVCGSGSSGEYGALASEGEHHEADEGVGVVEAERDSGDQADLGVRRFDERVEEVVVEAGVNRVPVGA